MTDEAAATHSPVKFLFNQIGKCGACRFSNVYKNPDGSADLSKRLCQRKPPALFVLGGPGGQPVFVPAYPPVDPKEKGCGDFEPMLNS